VSTAGLLSYHGYWCAHARIASIHPELAVADPAWREFEAIESGERERIAGLLRWGRRHVAPRTMVGVARESGRRAWPWRSRSDRRDGRKSATSSAI
jgi:hypothetical protein